MRLAPRARLEFLAKGDEMCGIIGVIGSTRTLEVLKIGMERLEYRGYDSAGIGCLEFDNPSGPNPQAVIWRKRACSGTRSVDWLNQSLDRDEHGLIGGIGHVRWATHGRPDEQNAHPHVDCTSKIAVVHNGIVENFESLKSDLVAAGHNFTSQTDSEVIAHLLESYASMGSSPLDSIKRLLEEIDGTFAMAVLFADQPDTIFATRRVSPLIVGSSNGVGLIASDIPAILGETDQVYSLVDDQIALVAAGKVELTDASGEITRAKFTRVPWTLDEAQKGGYSDFMSKEIFEQPTSVADTLRGRIDLDGNIVLDEEHLSRDQLREIDKVFIVACGSSFHAGLVAKYAIEHWARVPVEVDIASEFRYRDPILDSRTLVVGVSQSGETIDTIRALSEARSQGAKVLVITNVVDSSMTRECDAVLYTRAGPELGVAATKTHVAQIASLYLLAIHLAQAKNSLYPEESVELVNHLKEMPQLMAETLGVGQEIEKLVKRLVQGLKVNPTESTNQPTLRDPIAEGTTRFFFIGRNVGYPVAMEGALKLKEISYLSAEGYPAGELKHGPIALIEPGVIVIAIATRNRLWSKVMANLEEVKARGASVIVVASQGDLASAEGANEVIWVPKAPHPLMAPLLDVICLQFFAYYLAVARGNDVDRPRNLAKTVTVE